MDFFEWLTRQSRPATPPEAFAPPNAPPSALRTLGFWQVVAEDREGLLGWPHPAVLVDRNWEAERRERIVSYLRGGHTIASYMGYSFCRFKDCLHNDREQLGTKDLTDGRWVWPEGLWHYVANHGVRLPEAFVADAAANDFVVPAFTPPDQPMAVDPRFWLRWVAENTAPPPAAPEACSLEEAQAICAAISTPRWRASAQLAHERWLICRESAELKFEDFTGPISRRTLCQYLFRFRLIEPQAVLDPGQTVAIAREYAEGQHQVQPFAGATDSRGQTWWALIMSGTEPPTKPLSEIDFNAIEIPQSGWATFMPGGWKVETVPAMDEIGWRFFLDEWQQQRQPAAS